MNVCYVPHNLFFPLVPNVFPSCSQVVPEDVLNGNSVLFHMVCPKLKRSRMYVAKKVGQYATHVPTYHSISVSRLIVYCFPLSFCRGVISQLSFAPLSFLFLSLSLVSSSPPPSTPNLSPRTVCSPSLALSIFFTSFTCLSCLSHFSSLLTSSLSELCSWSASSPCSPACNIRLLKSSRRKRRRTTTKISLSHFSLAFSISLRFSVWVLCSLSVSSPSQHKLFKSSTKGTRTRTTIISLSTFSLDSLFEYVHDQCSLFLLQFKLLRFQQEEEEEEEENNNSKYKRACNLAGIC